MDKKGAVTFSTILIIMMLSIIGIFVVPAFTNLKDNFLASNYTSKANNMIQGAKSKFGADISNINKDGILEYTVEELIDEGYIKESELNSGIDKNSKVLVIIKNGYVTYKYVNGTTLVNKITGNMKKINNEFYYTSNNANNYISFNEEIYRIIKVDDSENIVIIKDDYDKELSKNIIDDYLSMFKNDVLSSKYSNMVNKEAEILDIETYNNTKENNETYLNKNYDFWILDNGEYRSFNSITGEFNNSSKAYVPVILKLDISILCESGDGSRVNPYIISK